MSIQEKICPTCKRTLRVESFPRKNENKDWLGQERIYVPREDICSECKSNQVWQKRQLLPLEQRLKPHVSRCFRRSKKRNVHTANEGITLELIQKRYHAQQGLCLYCHCVLEFQTRGMGWNLCMEDREALGVWPSTDNLITVDRVDASDPSLPYVDKDTCKENFSLLCFACNREKYYEEDAAEKLASRNALLTLRMEELENKLESYQHSLLEASLALVEKNCTEKSHEILTSTFSLLVGENERLEQQLKTMKRLAQNNFVQNVTLPSIQQIITSPLQKRKVDEKPVLQITLKKQKNG